MYICRKGTSLKELKIGSILNNNPILDTFYKRLNISEIFSGPQKLVIQGVPGLALRSNSRVFPRGFQH